MPGAPSEKRGNPNASLYVLRGPSIGKDLWRLTTEGALCGGKYTGLGLLLVLTLILSLLVPRRTSVIASNNVDLPTPFGPAIIITLGTLVHCTYFRTPKSRISNSSTDMISSFDELRQVCLI